MGWRRVICSLDLDFSSRELDLDGHCRLFRCILLLVHHLATLSCYLAFSWLFILGFLPDDASPLRPYPQTFPCFCVDVWMPPPHPSVSDRPFLLPFSSSLSTLPISCTVLVVCMLLSFVTCVYIYCF